jgi:hypothetical protein
LGADFEKMASFAPFRNIHACGLNGLFRAFTEMAMLGLLAGCAAPQKVADLSIAAPERSSWDSAALSRWDSMQFPNKESTRYTLDQQAPVDARGFRSALRAQANASASMLRTDLNIRPEKLKQIHFSWLVPALIEGSDMATRHGDDSPVRLVLAFEGDRSSFSAKDAALNELTRLVTGKEMPYATLMYVWCNERPVGSIIHNARTDRIRKIVIESGPQGLRQWRNYERDIRADFETAFGEAPGALVGIGIMTDSDNTQSQTQAWYGKISLQ